MNAADLFGIGGAWTRAFRADDPSDRRTIVPDSPISATAVRINSVASDRAEMEAMRDRLRTASTALRDAFGQFSRETNPVYTTQFASGGALTASAAGVSARVDPAVVAYQVLAATRSVNTQSSTARSSSSALGLDVATAEAASSLVSTAEMNTGVTTAYGSSSLAFGLGGATSSSVGSLTGTYTGTGAAANATSLTVEITQGDTIGGGLLGLGTGDIDFEVRDQTGSVLFSYSGTLSTNEDVYLGADIGLTISFSAGQLKNNHTASTTVTKTPITVDGNAAFNASASLRPKFEGGAVVTAGSFTVNGTSITVNANDTIDTVLSRINSSGAGVTASLSGDKVTLTSNGNSEDAIVTTSDTSGFLSATKLAAATTTLGNIRDDQQRLSKTTQFDDVIDGSFTVNGAVIAVDKDTDTLASVLARVNSAGVGVTASYDSVTDTITFAPNAAGATLTIENDSSGFLAEAKVATGTVASRANPDAAFNAAGASGPLFDSGLAVQAGSFTVNGVAITVAADDTINGVLAKITASAAGVTAVYDADSDTVTLTATQFGTSPITLGGDTSGFLAAVKLDGTAVNTTNPATVNALSNPLAIMAEYAAVTPGTLTVNGQDIAIDPSSTTLVDLVAALNDLEGIGATVNMNSGGIQLWSEEAGSSLTIADTSGVLAALGIDAGTYAGIAGSSETTTTQTGTVTTSNAADVASDVADALRQLNEVVVEIGRGREDDDAFQQELEDALDSAVDLLRDSGFRGLSVSGDGSAPSVELARDTLVNALNGLRGDLDVPRAIASLVDSLDANVAAAAGWELEPEVTQSVRLEDTTRAQLTADQTQASLLMLRSSLQPQESEETAAKAAMKAYGEAP